MKQKKQFIQEIQFTKHYDVIVVGGGTTGVCAALAAARSGAKTAIVEYYGFLGGNATNGLPWMAFHNYKERKMVIKGIPFEIVERLRKVGGATEFHMDPIVSSTVGINPTWLKVVLAEMVTEEKMDVYLHSLAVGVEMQEQMLKGVYINNKQGCQLLAAKTMIDCTDSGDIAVLSGADYEFGRRHDSKVQVSSYIHLIGNIDMDALITYFEQHPDQMRPHKFPKQDMDDLMKRMRTTSVFIMGAFKDLIAQAKNQGLEYDRDTLIGVAYTKERYIMLVSSRVENVNLNDVENFSRAELLGMRQTQGIMDFVTRYMPGGKDAFLIGSGHQIGVRESRHIIGDYYLTGKDLLIGKKFDDVVVLGAYFLDIHSPDHAGLAPMKQPPTYQIPYRALLPKGIEGLLVAGRCISADHDALSSTRVIPISAAQGQAAGTAAALAAHYDIFPRDVDIRMLQKQLLESGAALPKNLDV